MPLPSFPNFSGLPDFPGPRRLLLDCSTLLDHQVGGGKHIFYAIYNVLLLFLPCCWTNMPYLMLLFLAHVHFIYIYMFCNAICCFWSMNFWCRNTHTTFILQKKKKNSTSFMFSWIIHSFVSKTETRSD